MPVSRGPLVADTFGARAPILPRVILPLCIDPSHYISACGLQMSCGGSKARLFPIKHSYIRCVHFPAKCRVLAFLGITVKIMYIPSRKNSKPARAGRLLYCGRPATRSNFETFQIRGQILGNSHPFPFVCCNSREITHSNREEHAASLLAHVVLLNMCTTSCPIVCIPLLGVNMTREESLSVAPIGRGTLCQRLVKTDRHHKIRNQNCRHAQTCPCD